MGHNSKHFYGVAYNWSWNWSSQQQKANREEKMMMLNADESGGQINNLNELKGHTFTNQGRKTRRDVEVGDTSHVTNNLSTHHPVNEPLVSEETFMRLWFANSPEHSPNWKLFFTFFFVSFSCLLLLVLFLGNRKGQRMGQSGPRTRNCQFMNWHQFQRGWGVK